MFKFNFKKELSYEEGLEIVQYAIKVMKTRFLMSQNNFIVKVVDKVKKIILKNKKE